MYFILNSKLKIGETLFKGVNNVQIKRSIHSIGATATIRVPVTAVLKAKGKPATNIETASAVKKGDKVTIDLGYNGDLKREFSGYVKGINYKTPLEIECEDGFYLTRQKSVTLSGTMTLKDCLKKCGLQILHAVDLTLKNFAIDDKPVSWVLGKLKTDYGLSIFFDMEDKVVAGRFFDLVSDTVKYELRLNTIKDDDLKYQLAADKKLKVKAICYQKDGTKVEAKMGEDGGTTKTLYFYDVEDMAELKMLAEHELKKYSYDGYSGKITTFLQPYAEPCMVASITDPVYGERDGKYFIESTEVRFGTSGARREVSIGIEM